MALKTASGYVVQGLVGALKTREWKTWDWKAWHKTAGLENAGLENTRTDWLWKTDQA